ncbi:hypothetical protein V3C99_010168 [Haemonchus contortus]
MKLLILLFIAAAAAHPGIIWMELLHAPFLAEVSWNAQFDYFKILYNQTLTIAKQKEEIKLWAKRNDVSKEVTSFFHKFNKRMEKTNKNVAKVIHALPIALRNLTKIMKNEKQTLPEMVTPRTSRAHTKRTQNRMRDVKSRMSPLPMDLIRSRMRNVKPRISPISTNPTQSRPRNIKPRTDLAHMKHIQVLMRKVKSRISPFSTNPTQSQKRNFK